MNGMIDPCPAQDRLRELHDELMNPDPPPRPGYDPVPDLAALIDGIGELAAANPADGLAVLGNLLCGPYTRLRGGLLLDYELAGKTTAEALRGALEENRNRRQG